MSILDLVQVTKRFGALTAVSNVTLTVEEGAIFGIIGPNGAGKSTLFNLLTAIYRFDEGSIAIGGTSIAGLTTQRIAKLGVARTFQNLRLFGNASALANVMVGEHLLLRANVVDSLLDTARERRERAEAERRARELLRFVGIAGVDEQFARNLPYGTQRRLEIARALAARPRLLLLDEPAAGLNPSEKRDLLTLIRAIRDTGATVLLIEHDMGLVMDLCERIAVLDYGEKIAEGAPSEIREHPRVIEAYLGAPA